MANTISLGQSFLTFQPFNQIDCPFDGLLNLASDSALKILEEEREIYIYIYIYVHIYIHVYSAAACPSGPKRSNPRIPNSGVQYS